MVTLLPLSLYLIAFETRLIRTCCSRKALARTSAFGAKDVSITSSTSEIDAMGLQKLMESSIGPDAAIEDNGNSSNTVVQDIQKRQVNIEIGWISSEYLRVFC